METSVSSSLVCLHTAKQVWDRVKEMFFGIGNLCRTYDLHQAFFCSPLMICHLSPFTASSVVYARRLL